MDDKSAVSVSTSVSGGEIFFNKSKKKFISEKLGPSSYLFSLHSLIKSRQSNTVWALLLFSRWQIISAFSHRNNKPRFIYNNALELKKLFTSCLSQ
jgi:hypothetical protein